MLRHLRRRFSDRAPQQSSRALSARTGPRVARFRTFAARIGAGWVARPRVRPRLGRTPGSWRRL